MAHKFDELKWVTVAGSGISELSDREAERLAQIRANYPELVSWGDAALNEAWGWYSEDCWLVSMQAVEQRDAWFLGYLLQVERGHGRGKWCDGTELARQGAAELGLIN